MRLCYSELIRDPDTVVAVFHSEEHLKEQGEKKEKTYYELTGRPDLRPTKYEDLAVNISYSSDGRAYNCYKYWWDKKYLKN